MVGRRDAAPPLAPRRGAPPLHRSRATTASTAATTDALTAPSSPPAVGIGTSLITMVDPGMNVKFGVRVLPGGNVSGARVAAAVTLGDSVRFVVGVGVAASVVTGRGVVWACVAATTATLEELSSDEDIAGATVVGFSVIVFVISSSTDMVPVCVSVTVDVTPPVACVVTAANANTTAQTST